MPGKHAKLSPSSADRWFNCPASMIPDVPVRDDSNAHAARGTALHAISEKMLLDQDITTDDLNPTIDSFDIRLSAEDVDQAEVYADYVRNGRTFGDTMLIEQKLDMASWIPEGSGTADAQLITPLESVEVIDAKFGSGKHVSPESLQVRVYMIAAWDEHRIKNMLEFVQGTIVQPPFSNEGASIEMYPEEIEDWREKIRVRADLAWAAHHIDPTKKKQISATEHEPGDWCEYCPRLKALKCMAVKHAADDAAAQAFDALEDDRPIVEEEIDVEELAKMKNGVKLLELFIKAVNEKVSIRLKAGKPVPGWKLVAGRKSRSWQEDEEITEYLRKKQFKVAEIMTTALKLPAQIEKLVKESGREVELDEYIKVSPGRPTIAPESDRRKAIDNAAVLEFDKIEK